MKFLYYSTAYYADHGGSIQSIEFFKNLEENILIDNQEVFPTSKKLINSQQNNQIYFRSFLKKIPLAQTVFFYRRNRKYLKELEEFIKSYKPDILLLQIDSNFLQIDYLKSKFPNLFIATQINASPFDEPFKNIAFKRLFLRKQKRMYNKSDMNIFISSFLRERIMGEFLDLGRDIVVHNGTDTSKFQPLKNKKFLRSKHDYPTSDLLLGYIGTLDFHKKLDLLIKAFSFVTQKFPKAKLVIIGDGPAVEELKEIINNLSLTQNVILKGWIEHGEMNEHLNCFDIAIHHHANDYMSPLKLFEYLSSGLPVIAPDIPAVREIFEDNQEMLLVKPNPSDISKKIFKLIEDDVKRKELSELGPVIIQKRHTWKKYTGEVVKAIELKMRN